VDISEAISKYKSYDEIILPYETKTKLIITKLEGSCCKCEAPLVNIRTRINQLPKD